MSWPLIKKDEYPSFMKGLLVAFMICFWIWFFHPKAEKTDTRSLPLEVACLPNQKLVTSVFTEDKLNSIPIKPKEPVVEEESKDETKAPVDDGTKDDDDETTRTYTPIETPVKETEEEEIPFMDEVIVDPDEQIVDTQEGDIISTEIIVPIVGTPEVVTPSTERDDEIISTITTTDDSQNLNNGSLSVRIKRKF